MSNRRFALHPLGPFTTAKFNFADRPARIRPLFLSRHRVKFTKFSFVQAPSFFPELFNYPPRRAACWPSSFAVRHSSFTFGPGDSAVRIIRQITINVHPPTRSTAPHASSPTPSHFPACSVFFRVPGLVQPPIRAHLRQSADHFRIPHWAVPLVSARFHKKQHTQGVPKDPT